MSEKKKVILDTDIGSDIDDAFCLAYLLNEKDCDLLGVTTVTGKPVKRAQIASAICIAAGKPDVPIFPGTENPILIPLKQKMVQQEKALPKWKHKSSFPRYGAIEFIRSTVRKYPGEVTLIAIGPMTNIGLLFAVDPEIPGLLKELVLMCGVFFGDCGRLEWNALGDPHATSIMYSAPVKNIRSYGLDVTMKVQQPSKDVKANMKAPALQPVKDFLDAWKGELVTFHDPLAAVSIFHKDICGYKRGRVEVETESAQFGGLTRFVPDEKGNNEVACDVKADQFFKYYWDTVNGK